MKSKLYVILLFQLCWAAEEASGMTTNTKMGLGLGFGLGFLLLVLAFTGGSLLWYRLQKKILKNVLDGAEEKILVSLKKLELASKNVQGERQHMRLKIARWEEKEKTRAIQKALYHHLSRDNLAGDYQDHEVNPEVVNMLSKMEINRDSQVLEQNYLDMDLSKL